MYQKITQLKMNHLSFLNMLYKLCKDRLGNLLYCAYSIWCFVDSFVDWHSKALFPQ